MTKVSLFGTIMSFVWLELILDRPVDAAIAFTVGVNSMGDMGFLFWVGWLDPTIATTCQPTTGSRIYVISMSMEDERFGKILYRSTCESAAIYI